MKKETSLNTKWHEISHAKDSFMALSGSWGVEDTWCLVCYSLRILGIRSITDDFELFRYGMYHSIWPVTLVVYIFPHACLRSKLIHHFVVDPGSYTSRSGQRLIHWLMSRKNYGLRVLTHTMLIAIPLFVYVQRRYGLSVIFLHKQCYLIGAWKDKWRVHIVKMRYIVSLFVPMVVLFIWNIDMFTSWS